MGSAGRRIRLSARRGFILGGSRLGVALKGVDPGYEDGTEERDAEPEEADDGKADEDDGMDERVVQEAGPGVGFFYEHHRQGREANDEGECPDGDAGDVLSASHDAFIDRASPMLAKERTDDPVTQQRQTHGRRGNGDECENDCRSS